MNKQFYEFWGNFFLHTMLVDHLQRSLKEQNDQFQSLMESIRSSFGKDG